MYQYLLFSNYYKHLHGIRDDAIYYQIVKKLFY